MNDNDNRPYVPIQVLAVSCAAIDEPVAPQCAWLHGYALLTIQPSHDGVQLTGTVEIGERYARDDHGLIAKLEAALDPDAVLAGLDLTSIVGRLGRLPIGVEQQDQSLALLDKVETMLLNRAPIDITLNEADTLSVLVNVGKHSLRLPEERSDEGEAIGIQLFGCPDNMNSVLLAAQLSDTVGAAALAIGEHYLEPGQGQSLEEQWQRWRQDLRAGWEFDPDEAEFEPVA